MEEDEEGEEAFFDGMRTCGLCVVALAQLL